MDEQAVLKLVYNRIAGGQNVALIASRRNDATNLLRTIGQPQVYSQWLPDAQNWVFAYLASEQVDTCRESADLWQLIWRTLAAQAIQQPWYAHLDPLTTAPTMKADRALWLIAEQQGKLVLFFDRMDDLAKKPEIWTMELLGPLRSWSSRYSSFNIVFSSNQPLSELNRLQGGYGSPLFNTFTAISLDELESTEV